MINRKIFFTLLTSVTISGVIVICSIAQNLRNEKIKAKTPPVVSEVESAPYVIKRYNNILAVFRGESSSPFRILDCDFNMLADADKEILENGISVYNESELNSIIEDFTS